MNNKRIFLFLEIQTLSIGLTVSDYVRVSVSMCVEVIYQIIEYVPKNVRTILHCGEIYRVRSRVDF